MQNLSPCRTSGDQAIWAACLQALLQSAATASAAGHIALLRDVFCRMLRWDTTVELWLHLFLEFQAVSIYLP